MQNSDICFDHYLKAQEFHYHNVIVELTNGKKRGHWMWFIFPQIEGLGISTTSKKYAIKNIENAHAYINHELLGQRLKKCSQLLLTHQAKTAKEIFGNVDAMKLHSSMTLFSQVQNSPDYFQLVLDTFFYGNLDNKTLALL